MAKKLIIGIGKNTRNLIYATNSDADKIYLPFKDYNWELDLEEKEEPDIWAGIETFNKARKNLSKLNNDEIIIITQGCSYVIQGFIYSLSKYLKRKRKKVKVILNGNRLSKFFISELKKYSVVKDVYNSKKYQKFLKENFPKVSLFELDGFLNTLFLKEMEKA